MNRTPENSYSTVLQIAVPSNGTVKPVVSYLGEMLRILSLTNFCRGSDERYWLTILVGLIASPVVKNALVLSAYTGRPRFNSLTDRGQLDWRSHKNTEKKSSASQPVLLMEEAHC